MDYDHTLNKCPGGISTGGGLASWRHVCSYEQDNYEFCMHPSVSPDALKRIVYITFLLSKAVQNCI